MSRACARQPPPHVLRPRLQLLVPQRAEAGHRVRQSVFGRPRPRVDVLLIQRASVTQRQQRHHVPEERVRQPVGVLFCARAHRYRTHSAQRDRVTRRRDGVAVGGIPQGSRDIPWDGSLSATSASRRAFAGGGRDVDSVFDTVSPSSSSLSCLSTTGGFTASSLCSRSHQVGAQSHKRRPRAAFPMRWANIPPQCDC